MGKRLLKEQTGFHGYHTNNHAEVAKSDSLKPAPGRGVMNQARPATSEQRRGVPSPARANTRARVVVKTPQPVPASTWTMREDRRAQLRRRPGETYTVLVPRTLVQSGAPASSGRMRAIRQAQLQHSSASPIPVRSGRNGRRRGFFARMLALLVVVAMGVIGVNFALTSQGFRVEQVNVAGTENPALVADIEHMGIQGQNIFLVDTAALTDRVEVVPLVASA